MFVHLKNTKEFFKKGERERRKERKRGTKRIPG